MTGVQHYLAACWPVIGCVLVVVLARCVLEEFGAVWKKQ